MKRFLPKSLNTQLLLLLAVALIVANLATLVLMSSDRRDAVRKAQRFADLERTATLVPAVSVLEGAIREQMVRASSRRFMRLRLSDTPNVQTQPRVPDLEARFAEEAGIALDDVRITIAEGRDRQKHGTVANDGKANRVLVSVPLPDGDWLNATIERPHRHRNPIGAAVLIALALSLVSVLGVATLFLRRITGPIRALTQTLRQAGRGDRTALAPVWGAKETREAAQAFNTMQQDMARFDAERARIVAAVGHDLRTPITSLRIRAEMLEEEDAKPMVRILNDMRVMADGLLAWSRGDAEIEELERVDLAAMLRQLCEGQSEPQVRYDGPDHAHVRGRPVALRRALANLIDNMRRYGVEDGDAGTVRLSTGETLSVTFDDNGPGVPADRIDAILQPFARGELSRSPETGGTGLGLSIAQTIIRAHGGTLTLTNRSEGGLRATVELPAEQVQR